VSGTRCTRWTPLSYFRAFHHFEFPALGFGVARVHAEEVAGENAGFVAAGAGADFQDDVFVVDGIMGKEEKFQLALGLFFADGEKLFFFLGHVAHFGVFGFDDHLMGAGEVLFNLLELAVFVDDGFEIGVLLGEFLEARGIGDDLGSGQFLGHFLVAGVELIEFFGKRESGHWDSFSPRVLCHRRGVTGDC
jgi:hypothetical protein